MQEELTESLNIDQSTISRHLKAIGMIRKQGNRVRRTINIDGKAEYSRRQAHALYLVGSDGFNALRAAPTQRNHHCGTLQTTTDAIERSIEANTARLGDKTQQRDFPARQRSALSRETTQGKVRRA
ncbi:hypothetical protein AVEN_251616-1 [Araneus ventricosus]|uniref:Uncharacterized protein n=1 Tax=Araneus ventricosus TaxID=182803 RepID=A0A4Y2EVE1_ARAVE|nr:hypothetical protein AVEN_251616-1 [Araneus ventricosus]